MTEEMELKVGDFISGLANSFHTDFSQEVYSNTPRRVVAAYQEMLSGYNVKPKDLLSKTFKKSVKGMLVQGPIRFVSVCEHHLLPFDGVAFVSYITHDGKVVGLSKISRVVYAYAKRLQLQEQMTAQIADLLEKYLSPDVAVLTIASHGCMTCRGVANGAPSSWAELRGLYFTQDRAREEFYQRVELNWRLQK